jgi:hypothetical protein
MHQGYTKFPAQHITTLMHISPIVTLNNNQSSCNRKRHQHLSITYQGISTTHKKTPAPDGAGGALQQKFNFV